MEQKPDIVKTRVPIAEENLPSFATTDSKKLRPVWISGIVNYVVMVIVISVVAFSTPEEEFKFGWAKRSVGFVGGVIPSIDGLESLKQKGWRKPRTPFMHAAIVIWLLTSNLCIAMIIKRPFIKYRGESFRKFKWIRIFCFFLVLLFLTVFILVISESKHGRINDDGTFAPFIYGLMYHLILFNFSFFLINFKEFYKFIFISAGESYG